MTIGKTLYVTDRKAWRAWLAKHHDKEKEIWLVFYKAHTGKARVPYNDAVEEALCYGWIDSIVKRIDDESFAQRFSPRRSTAKWSEPNKERVRRLIKQRKMTRFGAARFDKSMMVEHGLNSDRGRGHRGGREKKMDSRLRGNDTVGAASRRGAQNPPQGGGPPRLIIPPEILKALKKDTNVWANFQKFPESYKRIRIGWIVGAKRRPEIFQQRLRYFIKMTLKNKKYGQVQ
jgi:uncharacterized protein YdeI (YjbR/CyaY-like superfamily)